MKRGRGQAQGVWDYGHGHRQHPISLQSYKPPYPGEQHAVPMPTDPRYERRVDYIQGRPQEGYGAVQDHEADEAYLDNRRQRPPPAEFSRQEPPYRDSVQRDFRSIDERFPPAEFPHHDHDDLTYHHYRDHGSGPEDQKAFIHTNDTDRLKRNRKYKEPAYHPSGHDSERQHYSSRVRSPDHSGGTVARHDHLRDRNSFRRHEGRSDRDGSGGKRNQTGHPVRRRGFEQEYGGNEDKMHDSFQSHKGARSSVSSRDSGRDHGDRLHKFASAVSKIPSARPAASPKRAREGGPEQERCRYQDIPRSPRPHSDDDAWRHRRQEPMQRSNVFPQQAYKRKWSSDFGPVPFESQPSAPKQSRPPPGLLDQNLGVRDLPKRPDLERLLDEDGRPTKRKMGILEVNSLTMDKKLQYFINLVRNSPVKSKNDGDIMNQALMSSPLDWKLMFSKEDVSLAGLGTVSIITLALGNIVLARGVGYGKAALKRKCNALALQRLRSMDAQEILMLEFVRLDKIRKMVEKAKESVKKPVKSGWENFIDALNDLEPVKIDIISRIERAMVNSKCGMERMFSVTKDTKKGRMTFTGSLLIGGILQGESTSFIIKECKIMAYEMAYNRFMSLEMPDILKGITPSSDIVDEGTDADISITPVSTPQNFRRLERFTEKMKTSMLKENAPSRLTEVSHCLEIPIITIHRMLDITLPRSPSFVCEVFLGDILIGVSKSEAKDKVKGEDKVNVKDKVKDQAFDQALQRVMTASAQELLAETCCLKPEMLYTPSVMEVCVKGENKRLESSAEEMARYYGRILEVPKDWRSQMVIVETQECDRFIRKGCSTAILRNSAVMSGVVMSYIMSSVQDLRVCLVKLQGEVMGKATGYDWKEVKILAAADALFKLYETQPVLKAFKRTPGPPDNWVTKEQLMKKIETMDPSEFDEEKNQQMHKLIQKHNFSKGNKITEEQKEEMEMFPRLCLAAFRVLQELMDRGDCLEEVYFAPEVFRVGRTGVGLCTSIGGRLTVNRHRKNDSYCSVLLRAGAQEILAKLKERGITETNYFELVQDKSDFPRHADIAKEVEESLTLPKQYPEKNPSKDPAQSLSGNSDDNSSSSLPATSDQQTAVPDTTIVSTQVAPKMLPKDSLNLQSKEKKAVMTHLAKALKQAGLVHAGFISDETTVE